MNIFLAGGSGLLGSYIRKTLSQGNNIIAPDKYALDIRNNEQLTAAITESEPDAIINASGMTNVYMCEKKQEDAFSINAKAPSAMAKLAYDYNVKFIHFSTNFIFDGSKETSYIESDKPNPVNNYAKSKYEAEQGIMDINSNALIIRSAEIFGVGTFSAGHNIPYYIVRQIINKRNINLYNIITSPTYALHIAQRIPQMIENDISGVLHIVNRGELSYFNIAETILELMHSESQLKLKESVFDFDAPSYIPMDSERYKDTGLQPMPDTETAIREFLKEVL